MSIFLMILLIAGLFVGCSSEVNKPAYVAKVQVYSSTDSFETYYLKNVETNTKKYASIQNPIALYYDEECTQDSYKRISFGWESTKPVVTYDAKYSLKGNLPASVTYKDGVITFTKGTVTFAPTSGNDIVFTFIDTAEYIATVSKN